MLLDFWFSVFLNSFCIIKNFLYYYFRFLVYLSPCVRLLLVFAWGLTPAQSPVLWHMTNTMPLWCHQSIHIPPAFKIDLQLNNLQHVINLNINLNLFRISESRSHLPVMCEILKQLCPNSLCCMQLLKKSLQFVMISLSRARRQSFQFTSQAVMNTGGTHMQDTNSDKRRVYWNKSKKGRAVES